MGMRASLFFCLMLCLGCAGRIPLPEAYRVANTQALLQRMQHNQVPAQAYSAEARLSYFGASGRFKGTASLLVARPNKLRYELQGPHGGVLLAVACDGQTLSLLDLRQGAYQHLPATPHNLDKLMQWVPLNLGAEGWVGLLFGEVSVPPAAALRYDERRGAYVLHWDDAAAPARQMDVWVDPATARVVAAAVQQAGQVLSDVRIEAWTPEGLPAVLRLRAPGPDADVEVRLRDVSLDPALDGAAFMLNPAP